LEHLRGLLGRRAHRPFFSFFEVFPLQIEVVKFLVDESDLLVR
jgi:hypothetical protein